LVDEPAECTLAAGFPSLRVLAVRQKVKDCVGKERKKKGGLDVRLA